LSHKRPIFHNEADFQHALAWTIRECYPDSNIRLEMKVHGRDSKIYLDILVIHEGRRYAIELKYKTRLFEYEIDSEEFYLNNQGAQDIGRYDVLKDLQRLEQMVTAGVADEGVLLFLTNDASYYSNASPDKQTADRDFRLHEGRTVQGTLTWGPSTGQGTMKGREEPLSLQGNYQVHWAPYTYLVGQSGGDFRYLLLTVKELNTRSLSTDSLSVAAFDREQSHAPSVEKVELSSSQEVSWLESFTQLGEIPLSQFDLRDRLANHLRQMGYSVQINRDLGTDKIDIWARRGNEIIAIEVRNKTALLDAVYCGKHIHLKNQAAQDISRYDFVSDIGKLERVVRSRSDVTGYALLLTNDPSYWQPPRKADSFDEHFRIHDGRVLKGICSWSIQASAGTTSGRDEVIHLHGAYHLQWQPYLRLGFEKNAEFRLLLVKIG
ncbi:MAG TPA: hypothetical protein VMW36_08005, partial [Patescibacteria group bacterium]|nr:hypothetical protein [Patescibacteria group bacterium]